MGLSKEAVKIPRVEHKRTHMRARARVFIKYSRNHAKSKRKTSHVEKHRNFLNNDNTATKISAKDLKEQYSFVNV